LSCKRKVKIFENFRQIVEKFVLSVQRLCMCICTYVSLKYARNRTYEHGSIYFTAFTKVQNPSSNFI
jgi:hypothetical protein